MFELIREETARQFGDLKAWVQSIPSDGGGFSQAVRIDYGLFFVYLYGILENAVGKVVSTVIQELNRSNTPLDACVFELYSLVLWPDYEGLLDIPRKAQKRLLEKKWEISSKLAANATVYIPPDIMPTDGRNVRFEQLQSIANSFGMQDAVLPRMELKERLREIVMQRNTIAHGEKPPIEVGRNYTKKDLLERCDDVSEICEYTCNIYEKYIAEKEYLRVRAST